MQDADLLLSLAGIAGVFVGFGALISTRSGSTSEAVEVAFVRGVVSRGLVVVVAALAPVAISRYGIIGHELWLLTSLIALVLYWVVILVNNRTPGHTALFAAAPRAAILRVAVPAVLVWVSLSIALILVVLGPFPDLEPALYLTAVVLVLLEAAFYLMTLVYSQGRPATA